MDRFLCRCLYSCGDIPGNGTAGSHVAPPLAFGGAARSFPQWLHRCAPHQLPFCSPKPHPTTAAGDTPLQPKPAHVILSKLPQDFLPYSETNANSSHEPSRSYQPSGFKKGAGATSCPPYLVSPTVCRALFWPLGVRKAHQEESLL